MKKKVLSLILALASLSLCFASCGKGEKEPQVTDTAPETEAVTEVSAPKVKTLRFLAAGDNIIHECVYLDAKSVAASVGGASDYYFDSMYSEVEEAISSADIAFINAEGPLDADYAASGYPNFNAPVEAGEALVNVGFDVINLANNHMLDLNGAVGLRGTIDYWKNKDVMTIGGYEGEEDYNTIRVFEKDGVKIAFLSYTFSTNGNYLGSGVDDLWVPYIDDADVERHISEAKGKADLVFVSMHWGDEDEFEPNAEQKRLAQLIADCGADVIIGHHTHTIQPVEWLTGKDGNRTLVTYSLGNFLHTQLYSDNLVGGVVTFDIVCPENEKPSIDNVMFIPTVCHYTADTSVRDSLDYFKRENVKIYWLADYTEELASAHGSQNWGAFTLSDLRDTVSSTIPSEFLPESYK